MNGQYQRFASNPYPKVPTGPANDPTPRDQAIYVPAISVGYAVDAHNTSNGFWSRMPSGVTDDQMNFLHPNNQLFRISHALFSAGQAMMHSRGQLQSLAPNIVTTRDRATTRIIVDSGGFQVSKNRHWINGHRDRLQILEWMETHGDIGMTLDIPPGPVGVDPSYQYKTFADCLSTTLDHLKFFDHHRSNGDFRLLTVLHGRNQAEADEWYNQCKVFPFSGWAFGGILRQDFYQLLRRILIMDSEKLIQDKTWIHILGTCELETAVLLTALQRAINSHINPNLRISYDTASPSIAMSYGKTYVIPNFETKHMSMPLKQAPNAIQYVGSSVRWPWPSPLGDNMVLGDMCVKRPAGARSQYDTLSNHFLTHHNLGALCWGIALANRVFDAESLNGKHTIAPHIGSAVRAINEVMKTKSFSKLSAYAPTLAMLKRTNPPRSGDSDRDIE